jgi:hypothetical protein
VIVDQERPFKQWHPLPRHKTRWQRHLAGEVIVTHRHIYHEGDDTKFPLWEEQIIVETAPAKLELVSGVGVSYPLRRRR